MIRYTYYFAGWGITNGQKYVESKSGDTLTVVNPFDESIVTAGLHVAGAQDIDDAVSAAKNAFTTGPWSTFTGAKRAACLNKFADLLESNANELAYLDSICMGMPAAVNSGFVVPMTASVFRCKLHCLVFLL